MSKPIPPDECAVLNLWEAGDHLAIAAVWIERMGEAGNKHWNDRCEIGRVVEHLNRVAAEICPGMKRCGPAWRRIMSVMGE
jgi:hypothetical protein